MSNIIQLFEGNVKKTPKNLALCFGTERLNYAELATSVSNLSWHLSHSGVKAGDHIGVLLPNGVEFVVLMLAAANLGLVIVPNNMSYPVDVHWRAFCAADVNHYVVWHSLLNEIRAQEAAADKGDSVWVSVGGAVDGSLNFQDLISTSDEINPRFFSVSASQPFILTMTSGSSGDPKPIVLTQETKINRARAAIQLYDITSDDVVLAATPLYHSLAERLVLLPLICGATCVLMAGFSAQQWLLCVEQYRVTFSIAVSSQLKQILSEFRKEKYQIDTLRCLVSSSELLDVESKSEFIKAFHCQFHECYGTSEVSIASNLSPLDTGIKVGSVGKPADQVNIQILNELGELSIPGEAGEIICKTPMLFSGYYKQPNKTESSMWHGYFRTGDLGRMDESGYLYFLGRKKEIIITGGVNVYPKDIEDVLLGHVGIAEATVVPIPDPNLGERVVAVIVKAQNTDIKKRELRRLCAKKLADFQQPYHYYFVDALARNPMGKVMKRLVVEQVKSAQILE